MAQSKDDLQRTLDLVQTLAEQRIWRPVPESPVELRITTLDTPGKEIYSAVSSLVEYAENFLGISLELRGGGYGCLDLGFISDLDESQKLEEAILHDPRFGAILNDLNAHVIMIRTKDATRTYNAFHEIKVCLATNREVQTTHLGPTEFAAALFGSSLSKDLTYGLVTLLIMDLSEGQSKESILKRIWKHATFQGYQFHERNLQVYVQQIDILSQKEFEQLLTRFVGGGTMLAIHGYANSFDDAVKSYARSIYRTKLDELAYLPILFSWPSRGSVSQYLPDTVTAENSEIALERLLLLLIRALHGKDVNLLAHSHGNKIAIRALCSIRTNDGNSANHMVKRTIFVEPDVDKEFLEQRLDSLFAVSEQIVIYHSKNDRALLLSSILFDSMRAGRDGVVIKRTDVEVIDASKVSRGLSKHTPHVESPEVISDIYYLLKGMKPKDRFGLKSIDTHSGRWEINPN